MSQRARAVFQLLTAAFAIFLSGCTTMSWTKQSMIGVYEFPAVNCPQPFKYPDKIATSDYQLIRHGRQIRCENSKTYKFTQHGSAKSESAVVSIVRGPTCKLVVALVLGREDSDAAYSKSRLESSQARAVQLAQFFSREEQLTLASSDPHAHIMNAVIDSKPRGAICRIFR